MPAPEVGVFTVVAEPVNLTLELVGRTAPYRIAEVRPQVGGIIKSREYQEGGQITAGEVLYRIDPARYQAAQDSAEAALVRARATMARARMKAERYANLVKNKAVSQEDFDDAEAALKEAAASVQVAEAALTAARIELEYTRIASPIDGRIGRSTVTQGALVTANQEMALATVQQLDPIHVDLTQSAAQQLRLRRDLEDGRLQRAEGEQPRVTLVLEDGSTYPHEGRLEFAEVSVDPGMGTVTLRATFPNPEHILLPGMFVRAQVEEGTRQDGILVPQPGIQRDRQGKAVALVLNGDGVVEQRQVETDRALGDRWLINAGLAPGDRLIVDGLQKARPGDQAKAVDWVPAGR
jgi:membrane fusion protein (multidrug efflux system)